MIGQEKHEFEQLCIWNPPDYQINKLNLTMIGQEKHEFEQLCIWNPPDYQINKLKKLIHENSMKFWGMRGRHLSREMSLSLRRGGCIRCSLKESFLSVTFRWESYFLLPYKAK